MLIGPHMTALYLAGLHTTRSMGFSDFPRYQNGLNITKTRLYIFNPPPPPPPTPWTPLSYSKIWVYRGIYYFFLILLEDIECKYPWEPPRRGGSNGTHNLCFEQNCKKYQSCFFLFENFQFLEMKFSIYFNRRKKKQMHYYKVQGDFLRSTHGI